MTRKMVTVQEEQRESGLIVIRTPNRGRIVPTVEGLTPLIHSGWSKARLRELLDAMQKPTGKEVRVRTPRPPKDPVACYNKCFYEMPPPCKPGHAILALAFKKVMVAACRDVEGLTMTGAKQLFHVYGIEHPMMIRIQGEPRMRNDGSGDAVRNRDGSADIRFRPEWPVWRAEFVIRFNSDRLSVASILNILAMAGEIGIGELRSDKSGNTFGQFKVVGAEGVA